VEALLQDEPEHLECAQLVERLIADRTAVIYNRFLELELWESIFNVGLRARHRRKQLRHVRFDASARGEAIELLEAAKQRWEDLLALADWGSIGLDEVAPMVPDLMGNYGFQSYDAVHVGTLLVSGANDLITRDNGFAALLPEDATIHTTQARLAATRNRRQRALARRARARKALV
jgi:predicted nucleic acid-binding protein